MRLDPTDQADPVQADAASAASFGLLEGVTAPVMVLDSDGRIVWLNDACQTLVGASRAELAGKLFWKSVACADSAGQATHRCLASSSCQCVVDIACDGATHRRVRWENRHVEDSASGKTLLVFTGVALDSPASAFAGDAPGEPAPLPLRQILDYAVFTLDVHGHLSSWGPAAQGFLGYRADSVLGHHFSQFYATDRQIGGGPQQQLDIAAQMGWSEQECWCVHEDGRLFWARVVITARYDSTGELVGYTMYVRDDTERKKAEDMQVRLARILDNSLTEIYVFSADSLRFQQVNYSARRNTGFSLEELQFMTPLDINPDLDRAKLDALTAPLRSGEKQYVQFTATHRRRNASLYPVEIRMQLLEVDAEPVFVASALDLTAHKQVESALHRTEGRLQTLFDSAAEFFFVIDPEGSILLTNRRVSEQSGFAEHELLGRKFKDFFSETSRASCDRNFHKLLEDGQLRGDIEFVCKDGRVIQMECSATGIPDEQGRFSTFLIIQRDVTERQRSAAALADSERRFRAIFNSQFQFIGLLDPQGIVLEANQAALDFCGLSNDDVVGRPFWETRWWQGSEQAQERLKRAIGEAASGKLVRYEAEHTGRHGERAIVDFSLKPVLNDQGETVLIIPEGRDITMRKRAEEEARRYQQESAHIMRLSTMGEMASGMAHELNQPLTALLSYCESACAMLDSLAETPDKLRSVMQRAMQQAHRASDIVRHLRHLVSKDTARMVALDPDKVIGKITELMQWELSNSEASIELELAGEGCRVQADAVQIEQVLINLLRNSLEAIRNAGIVPGKITVHSRVDNDASFKVTVSDNGPGVDREIRDEIFDSFRTSKASGMGMGLSISRSIIEIHGGRLWLDDTYGTGARFGFELPVSHD